MTTRRSFIGRTLGAIAALGIGKAVSARPARPPFRNPGPVDADAKAIRAGFASRNAHDYIATQGGISSDVEPLWPDIGILQARAASIGHVFEYGDTLMIDGRSTYSSDHYRADGQPVDCERQCAVAARRIGALVHGNTVTMNGGRIAMRQAKATTITVNTHPIGGTPAELADKLAKAIKPKLDGLGR